jgi:preprotein translocase subunit SecD
MRTGKLKVYLVLALVVAFGSLAAVIATNKSPRLGLDLEGGISVILTARGENIDSAVLQQTVDIIRSRIDDLGVAEPEVSIAGSDNIFIQLPGVENEEAALELIGTTAQLTFRQVLEVFPPETKPKDLPEVTEETGPEVNGEEVVYPSVQEGEEDFFYRLAPARLTGDVVSKAEAVVDTATGTNWSVSIDMKSEGAEEWADFTSELACLRDEGEQIQSQVAIVLDGRVESAAGMSTQPGQEVECDTGISGGQTSIDVGEEQDAKDLALVLRYGSLPVSLEQSEVQKVSPTLGRDSLQAGLRAGMIGLALVMIYMLLYYRALGLVVWLGLAIFASVIYVILTFLGETSGLSLSLAGVAGIIVSVGVTADSYIVAFERVKDEARSGKTIRAAADKGMTRAFRTILVADFVTGSAAVVLFFLAVGPVRGFALTLGLATLVDILIFFFFTRPAVQLLSRTKFFGRSRLIGMREALGVSAP